jgi:hypothetical protein
MKTPETAQQAEQPAEESALSYSITAEVMATADGVPTAVEIVNVGSLGPAIARHIAVEALAAWQGSFSTNYTLRATEQKYCQGRKTEVLTFTVEDFS